MLENAEAQVIDAIARALKELGFGERQINLRQIPFNGSWGYATAIAMQLAGESLARQNATEKVAPASEKATTSKKEKEGTGRAAQGVKGGEGKESRGQGSGMLQEEAQRLAEQLASHLTQSPLFSRVEAVRGYVNAYFDLDRLASDLINQVLASGANYGRQETQASRVMIEYSQPNTHKAFHIGHLRNVALGNSLAKILSFAGYSVQTANYIGDIGMHVIKCLWCYQTFHQGQAPTSNRGRWLGELYAEAETRLRYREDIVQFVQDMSLAGYFRDYSDRLVKELWQRKALGEDVAYLLGQTSNTEPRLDIRKFKDPDALKVFFDLIGPWLRDQVTQGKVPSDRLDNWRELHAHLDWWEHVPAWEQAVKETFQAWERQEPELLTLWQETRQWSLDEFLAIYRTLDATFDLWFYESEVEEEGRRIVQELLDRGIAEISEGLPVVKIDVKLGLEKEQYRVLPILRSDGTTLYSTKDLALAKRKFEQYGIDRSVYVVDVRQSLYMQQIFKVLELWGFPQAHRCYHLGYEFVALPEGAMSSRKGNATLFDDVLDEALSRARAIIDTKNPDLNEAQKVEISSQVAIGSLLYYMLSRDRNRVIVFDWDEALSFDGQAAPYIQYAHARAGRILERAETAITPGQQRTLTNPVPEEINLLQEIGRFGSEVERAARDYAPLAIANYVYNLARTFNDFYHNCPVRDAPEPQRTARLGLVAATRQVLANGLSLLGIAAPDVM